MGSGKASEAERIAAAIGNSRTEHDGVDGIDTSDRVVRGRATYAGKTYYVLAEGISQRTGKPYAKLAFRDGSRVFWAKNVADVEVVKRYNEPTSIDALRAYANRRRAEDAGEVECALCTRYCTCGTDRFCTHHHDGCDRCGMEC
ncbi:hypothetical protein LCGC14_0750210 [marine sediment metagenome]|uniref:Uncharacterized protein n=1 Tax=marine sediment metagenome TaxID=412755 RepID=A0A0F9TB52_9ZZZZ